MNNHFCTTIRNLCLGKNCRPYNSDPDKKCRYTMDEDELKAALEMLQSKKEKEDEYLVLRYKTTGP